MKDNAILNRIEFHDGFLDVNTDNDGLVQRLHMRGNVGTPNCFFDTEIAVEQRRER